MPNGTIGSKRLARGLQRLDEVSWSFEGARSRSSLSSTHFHPARFISQVPSVLVSLLSEPGDLILDPFCGSGTTLVEAQRLRRRSVGLDINPISVMISKAKTRGLGAGEVADILSELATSLFVPETPLAIPESVQAEKWYSQDVVQDLGRLYANIMRTNSEDAKLIKTFFFSSILMKVCRETRHWGYICDNTSPKSSPFRSVPETIKKSIEEFVDAFRGHEIEAAGTWLPIVEEATASRCREFLAPASVDLVVTSPPYFGVVDYVKSQRLSLEWLGLGLERYRLRESGARSKRHRILAESEFAGELRDSFAAIFDVLKPGAPCAVVFGVSPTRGFSFENLLTVLREVGFELQSDHSREISVQRTLMPSVLAEQLYVLTRPV